MPLAVKLEAAIRQLGLDPDDVHYDHHPALGLREYNPQTGLYTPDENNPQFIVLRASAAHRQKTTGRAGEKGSVVDGDIHKIAKAKRIAGEQEAMRRRLLHKQPGRGVKRQTKWRWGKRKLTGRGFQPKQIP